MNKKLLFLSSIALIAVSMMVSCSPKKKTLVGNDRDSHGCLASAGYTWSAVKNDCVRIFEVGVPLESAANAEATTRAYLVFSNDSTQVEAFLPTQQEPVLMRKQGTQNYWSTNPKFMGAFNLYLNNGKWTLYEGPKEIYFTK